MSIKIELTKCQIQAFNNPDWINKDDEVFVCVSELPNKENPNPDVWYVINGSTTDDSGCWSDIPRTWQAALRKA
jgi:hypothetical protein